MTELWKPIAWATDYEVSNLGGVKRVVADSRNRNLGRFLKPAKNLHGYLFVSICFDGRKRSSNIHSLVCEAFHGPRPTPKHEVAHYDGDQLNNRSDNLRWVTRKENFEDRDRHGRTARGARHGARLHPEATLRGEEHRLSKLTAEQVLAIRAAPPRSGAKLAALFGVTQTTISDVRVRKTWRHL